MNIANCFTNSVAVNVCWPDGSAHTLTLFPGQSVSASGVQVSNVWYVDGYSSNFVAVVNSTGVLVVGGSVAPAPLFMDGFFWAAPLTAILAAIWFIRRSMSGSTSGYSSE